MNSIQKTDNYDIEPTLFDELGDEVLNESQQKHDNESNKDLNTERTRWIELTALLHKYQKAYDADKPLVSDQEYDLLYLELKALEEKFGVRPDSPSVNIGFLQNELLHTQANHTDKKTLEDRAYITHMQPMLSLDHQVIENFDNTDLAEGSVTYEAIKEGFEFFKDKINRFLGMELDTEYEFIVQPKIDGVSISLHYENGELKTAALRGNGTEGEDVTDNILTMKTIPTKISYKEPIDVRGELFMSIQQFEKLSESGVIFASPRHAASGTARLLDSKIFAQRGLQLFIHGFVVRGNEIIIGPKYMDIYNKLQEDGFPMMPTKIAINTQDAIKFFVQMCQERDNLDFLLDGVVFKLNDLSLYETLASSAKAPRYAFALKFPAEQALAQILDIKWQVGRTGVLTPVIEIAETNIGGVNIRFVTMHNASEFLRHAPKKGDWARIERAGDVIPAIINIEHKKNAENNIESNNIMSYCLPEVCPSCNTKVVFDDKFLYCGNGYEGNGWKCKDQVIARLMHFVGRDAVDIDGLGEQRLEFLYDKNLLLYPYDIFTLFDRTESQQMFLDEMYGWGKKSVDKLYKQIEESRKIEFSRFLYALGIDGVGKNIANKIAKMCSSWEEFLAWLPTAENVDGIGKIMQEKMMIFIEQEREWIERLIQHINITNNADQGENFNGLSVVFTGTFKLSRQAMKEIALKNGFQVKDTVSSKIDYLVYGDDPGSKVKKAQEVGVKILNEEEWKVELEK